MAATAGTSTNGEEKGEKEGGCAVLLVKGFVGFLILGLMVGAAAAIIIGVSAFPAAAGLTGTPGKITVRSCEVHRLNSHSKEKICTGTFLSEDGREIDHRATVDTGSPGSVVSVRRTGSSTYTHTSAASTAGYVSTILFGLALAHTLFLAALSAWRGKRKKAETPTSWRSLAYTAGALGLSLLVQLVINLAT